MATKTKEENHIGKAAQEEVKSWKEKHKQVHEITVIDGEKTIYGYFKKPSRDIMANVTNLASDKKVFEAREFLLKNTFIGGEKSILTNDDYSIPAQTRLWTKVNFLTAEATTY